MLDHKVHHIHIHRVLIITVHAHYPELPGNRDIAVSNVSSGSTAVACQPGLEGRILLFTDTSRSSQVHEVPLAEIDVSVPRTSVWSACSTKGLYQGTGTSHCIPQEAEDPEIRLPG